MVNVYIDLEYTHGNHYMSDIIEMAATGEDSGWTFHKYINVNYKLPLNVTKLTGITDEKLSECAVSFKESFTELIEFVRQEQRGSDAPLTAIAHGGTRCDFPIILANCMKSDIDYDFLRECEFIDSVEVFKSNGCPKPGYAMCDE